MDELTETQKKLTATIEIAFWAGLVSLSLLALFQPLSSTERRSLILLMTIAFILIWITTRWLIKNFGIQSWVLYLGATSSVMIVASYSFLLKPYNVHVEILYISIIAGIGILGGRRYALYATILSVFCEIPIL